MVGNRDGRIVETGLITPPLGLNVLILRNISGGQISTMKVFKGVIPFVIADLVRLTLLLLFPPW